MGFHRYLSRYAVSETESLSNEGGKLGLIEPPKSDRTKVSASADASSGKLNFSVIVEGDESGEVARDWPGYTLHDVVDVFSRCYQSDNDYQYNSDKLNGTSQYSYIAVPAEQGKYVKAAGVSSSMKKIREAYGASHFLGGGEKYIAAVQKTIAFNRAIVGDNFSAVVSNIWPYTSLSMTAHNIYWLKKGNCPCLCTGIDINAYRNNILTISPQSTYGGGVPYLKIVPIDCTTPRRVTLVSPSALEPYRCTPIDGVEFVSRCVVGGGAASTNNLQSLHHKSNDYGSKTTDFADAMVDFSIYKLRQRQKQLDSSPGNHCWSNETTRTSHIKSVWFKYPSFIRLFFDDGPAWALWRKQAERKAWYLKPTIPRHALLAQFSSNGSLGSNCDDFSLPPAIFGSSGASQKISTRQLYFLSLVEADIADTIRQREYLVGKAKSLGIVDETGDIVKNHGENCVNRYIESFEWGEDSYMLPDYPWDDTAVFVESIGEEIGKVRNKWTITNKNTDLSSSMVSIYTAAQNDDRLNDNGNDITVHKRSSGKAVEPLVKADGSVKALKQLSSTSVHSNGKMEKDTGVNSKMGKETRVHSKSKMEMETRAHSNSKTEKETRFHSNCKAEKETKVHSDSKMGKDTRVHSNSRTEKETMMTRANAISRKRSLNTTDEGSKIATHASLVSNFSNPAKRRQIAMEKVTPKQVAELKKSPAEAPVSSSLPTPNMDNVSPINLYWVERYQLPCIFYDYTEQEYAENINLLPLCCTMYHYYVLVPRTQVRPLNESNVLGCTDDRTRDFACALMDFASWEQVEAEKRNSGRRARRRVQLRPRPWEDPNKRNLRNNAITQGNNSSKLYSWPDFILDLVANSKDWAAWRKLQDRAYMREKSAISSNRGSSNESKSIAASTTQITRRYVYFRALREEYLESLEADADNSPSTTEVTSKNVEEATHSKTSNSSRNSNVSTAAFREEYLNPLESELTTDSSSSSTDTAGITKEEYTQVKADSASNSSSDSCVSTPPLSSIQYIDSIDL